MPGSTNLTAADIRGVVAYIPTPIKTNITIDRNVTNPVDLDEAARAADVVIRDGASAICLNGTFGELPSLTWDEMREFTATVIESVKGRVPVFAGATTFNTRDTLARARAFRDMGATGLNLGRPMLSALGDPHIIQYYTDIATELPDMAIFLYDDPEAFKRPIPTTVYRELAKIPQIVGGKYRTRLLFGKMAVNTYDADLEAVNGRIKLCVNEVDWPFVYKNFGVDAIWSGTMCMVPGAVMAVQDALFAGDIARAEGIAKEILACGPNMIAGGNFEQWHIQKIPTLKARITAGGYIKAGPALPPYTYMDAERTKTAAECGARDRELQRKYPHKTMMAKPAAA